MRLQNVCSGLQVFRKAWQGVFIAAGCAARQPPGLDHATCSRLGVLVSSATPACANARPSSSW